MSMERCFRCSRAVDTDEDTEGDYFSIEYEHPVTTVYVCERCLEKERAEEELKMQMMTQQRAYK